MSDVPAPRLLAFLDESGCSGNQFGKGSSEFLVIGAAVYAAAAENAALSVFAPDPLRPHGRPLRKFSQNSDPDNFFLTKRISDEAIRTCQVALHKPSMAGSFSRANHQEEYQYLAKFAIERISWIARDSAYKNGLSANQSLVQLTFSEQRMYPYEALAEYLNKLKNGRERHNCSIDWDYIHPQFHSQKHTDHTGIHLADVVASALARAIERKQHGMTDDRFERNLISTLYRKHSKRYGLKLFPAKELRGMRTEGRFSFLAFV